MGFLLPKTMQKVFNAFATVSMIIGIGTVGSGVFLYKWATNPKTHEQLQQKVVESVKDSLKIPGMTGGAAPMGKTKLPF